MRIAFLNTSYWPKEPGGAERSVRFIAEACANAGHDAHVVCVGSNGDPSCQNGVGIHRLSPAATNPFRHPEESDSSLNKLAWHILDSYNPLSGGQVKRVLEKIKPDVVHTNNLASLSVSALSTAAHLDIPVVHTLRDYYLLCPRTSLFRNGRQCDVRCKDCSILSLPRAAATHHVHTVVGNSHFILKAHTDTGLFRSIRKEVIYNAYQPKDAPLGPAPFDAYPVFGYIGRLAPTKGVEYLIDALAVLPRQAPSGCSLLIAGTGDDSYVRSLKQRAEGLPVRFLGHVDADLFYSKIHWSIVPSVWHEPLARVLLESFVHGIPVIASNTGGSPELVADGANGYRYQATSISELAQLLRRAAQLSKAEYLRLADTARESGKRFSPQTVLARYLAVYRGACGRLA